MTDLRETLEYRKTATIRAAQWFKMGDHPAVTQLDKWKDRGWIDTLEGGHIVTPGDWIATGVQGEHWPIKPDVFAASYEPVSANPPSPTPPAGAAEELQGWAKRATDVADRTLDEIGDRGDSSVLDSEEALQRNWAYRRGFQIGMQNAAKDVRAILARAALSAPVPDDGWRPSQALTDIAAERRRQVEAEGWTPEHDDEHDDESLALAAACYALGPNGSTRPASITKDVSGGRGDTPVWQTTEVRVPLFWPESWGPGWWKPKDRRRDLIRAAALIVAETERLDRASALPPPPGQGEKP